MVKDVFRPEVLDEPIHRIAAGELGCPLTADTRPSEDDFGATTMFGDGFEFHDQPNRCRLSVGTSKPRSLFFC